MRNSDQVEASVNLKSSVHRTGLIAAIAALALLGACSSPPEKGGGEQASKAANATSVADLGGLDGLVAAAKQEGTLNVIALPPDWANYGKMISGFSAKYGIKITSAQPDASSQDEINAANQLKGTGRAPDVFDVGLNIALANTGLFAPYKVQGWNDIPDALKESSGKWFSDYGGYMSIGYDAGKVPAPTDMKDLLKPAYKGKVALNGDPTQAAAAFNGVVAAALDNGGSADDIAPGVQFFADLKKAGNFLPVDPTPATVASGQTPVVIDWDYLNAGQSETLKGKIDWKVVVPKNAVVGSYYVQAINKDAPHPAAARLWEEFLFSDEGQNIWLAGSARPIRADAMVKAGTIDKAAYSKLPSVSGTPVYLTEAQTNAAKEYLASHWTQAVG
jgi:putative spermidine/putrescine transport system substrate-binding protein